MTLFDQIKPFFLRMNDLNIDYVVMRNYNALDSEDYTELDDIDILIDRRQFKDSVPQLVRNYFDGYTIVFIKELNSIFIRLIDIKNDISIGLHFYFRPITNVDLFLTKQLLKNKIIRTYYYAIPERVSTLLEFYHRVFEKKGQFKKDYYFSFSIKDIEGIINYPKWIHRKVFAINNMEPHDRIQKISTLKWFLPSITFWKFVNKRNKWNKGKRVAFIGVDGAGKTTVIERLKQIFPNSMYVYMGSSQYYFDKIYKRFKGGFFTNSLKFFMVYFENWIKWFICIKGKINGRIVLIDRYPSFQNVRATGMKKLKYIIFYDWLFPKPKKLIYLYNDPHIIYERKQEHTIENLENIQILYDEKARNQTNVLRIKNVDINATIESIIRTMYGY